MKLADEFTGQHMWGPLITLFMCIFKSDHFRELLFRRYQIALCGEIRPFGGWFVQLVVAERNSDFQLSHYYAQEFRVWVIIHAAHIAPPEYLLWKLFLFNFSFYFYGSNEVSWDYIYIHSSITVYFWTFRVDWILIHSHILHYQSLSFIRWRINSRREYMTLTTKARTYLMVFFSTPKEETFYML